MKADIQSRQDVIKFVDTFYDKVRNDDLLSPVFNKAIQENWSNHMGKMYNFWNTVLLDEHTYSGAPFAAHMNLDIHEEHFKKWLNLFFSTLDELFEGEKTEEAKWRAIQMGKNFHSKLNYIRKTPRISPLQ